MSKTWNLKFFLAFFTKKCTVSQKIIKNGRQKMFWGNKPNKTNEVLQKWKKQVVFGEMMVQSKRKKT